MIVIGGLVTVVAGGVVLNAGASSSWPGCSSFATQPQAQAFWRAHGRPAAADRDHDGVVCEDLPKDASGGGGGQQASCTHTRRVIKVGLSKTRYPNILGPRSPLDSQGLAGSLSSTAGADGRRDRLLRDIPTKKGFDRDEYPPAGAARQKATACKVGRHPTGWKADVESVRSGESRDAGSVMGIKLRRYCNGTKFRYAGY